MTFVKFLKIHPRTTVQVFSNKLTGNLLIVIDTLKSIKCALSGCKDIQISKIDAESITVTWLSQETNKEYIERVHTNICKEISKKTHELKMFADECKQLELCK